MSGNDDGSEGCGDGGSGIVVVVVVAWKGKKKELLPGFF